MDKLVYYLCETVIIYNKYNIHYLSHETMAKNKDFEHFYLGIHNETFYSREEIIDRLSDDYVCGLIEGEGCFSVDRKRNGERIPSFVLTMHPRDTELLEAIRDYLGLTCPVYTYNYRGKNYSGKQRATLIIRDIPTLKNKIVPLFKNKLLGFKGTQFDFWIKQFPYLNSLIYRTNNVSRETVL